MANSINASMSIANPHPPFVDGVQKVAAGLGAIGLPGEHYYPCYLPARARPRKLAGGLHQPIALGAAGLRQGRDRALPLRPIAGMHTPRT